MRIIDLTHMIKGDMPVYPGTEKPKLTVANTIEKDQFRETLLTMYSHTGTHMDAPGHIIPGGRTLDEFYVDQFIGKALVIDFADRGSGAVITMAFIDEVKEQADQADFLLFRTGWDRLWGREAYFSNYPCVSEEVVDYVIASGKKGIGLDTISLDPVGSLKRHRKLLAENTVVIIENLTNMDKLGNGLFDFTVLPLKFEDADGAPVRAIGIV